MIACMPHAVESCSVISQLISYANITNMIVISIFPQLWCHYYLWFSELLKCTILSLSLSLSVSCTQISRIWLLSLFFHQLTPHFHVREQSLLYLRCLYLISHERECLSLRYTDGVGQAWHWYWSFSELTFCILYADITRVSSQEAVLWDALRPTCAFQSRRLWSKWWYTGMYLCMYMILSF